MSHKPKSAPRVIGLIPPKYSARTGTSVGTVGVPATTVANAWDRCTHEPSRSYSYFIYFRDLGPARTMPDVATDMDVNINTIKSIAGKWDWVQRARMWDDHLVRIHDEEIEKAAKTMSVRQAELGMSMQRVALKRVEQYGEDQLLLNEVSVADAARLADTGVRIERLARGENTGDDRTMNFVFEGAVPKWLPPQVPVTRRPKQLGTSAVEGGVERPPELAATEIIEVEAEGVAQHGD